MNKACLVLITALFVGPLMAGCLGGEEPPTTGDDGCTDASICGKDVKNVQGNGGIQGKVADEVQTLIEGANVTLVLGVGEDVKTKTDEFGAYTFANIPPGVYIIAFNKQQYHSTTKEVTVVADQIETVDAMLQSIPLPPPPYSENWEFTGLIACTVGYAMLTPDDRCADRDPNAKSRFKFAIENGLTGIAMHVDSQPDQTGEKIPLQVKWSNPPAQALPDYGGETPWIASWDFVATETVDLVDKATPGEASFNIRVDSCASPCKAYQTPFQVWVESFYWGLPIPEGFDPKPDA